MPGNGGGGGGCKRGVMVIVMVRNIVYLPHYDGAALRVRSSGQHLVTTHQMC